MNIRTTAAGAVIACVVCMGLASCASTPPRGPEGQGGRRGPQVMDLAIELSLFLPEGAVKVDAKGPEAGTEIIRDARLFLTAEQITGILPILARVKDAKQINAEVIHAAQKDIDAVLSDAQKEEYQELVAARDKSKSGSQGPGGGMGPGQGGPPGGGPGAMPSGPGENGGEQPPGGAGAGSDPRQILDGLIEALQGQLAKLTKE